MFFTRSFARCWPRILVTSTLDMEQDARPGLQMIIFTTPPLTSITLPGAVGISRMHSISKLWLSIMLGLTAEFSVKLATPIGNDSRNFTHSASSPSFLNRPFFICCSFKNPFFFNFFPWRCPFSLEDTVPHEKIRNDRF